jgi:hypothetical protein
VVPAIRRFFCRAAAHACAVSAPGPDNPS